MKKIVCLICGEIKKHCAKGLCESCYDKNYNKKYYLNHSDEIKQINKKYNKKYYLNHPDKVKQGVRNWQLNHPDEIKQYKEKWHRDKYDHPDLSKEPKIRTFNRKSYWVYPGGKYIHQVIGELFLGRKFKKGEQMHHIDKNGLNNNFYNLRICFSTKDHRECEKNPNCKSNLLTILQWNINKFLGKT